MTTYPYDTDDFSARTSEFLACFRKAPLRDAPSAPLLDFAERVEGNEFKAFIHTLAIHAATYVRFAGLEINGALLPHWEEGCSGPRGSFNFASDRHGRIYRFTHDEGAAVIECPEREDSTWHSFWALLDELCDEIEDGY